MPKLMLSGKVCLRPTKAQARLLEKYAKAAIWTWNECLSWWQERYDVQGLNTNSNDCIKHLQHLKRESPEHYWLQSIPESVTKRVIKQLETAYKDFYAGKKGHPKYKKQTQSNMSFYQRTDRFRVVDATHVKITGIRDHVKVETTSGIPEKVYNTVVSWDGKHWQLAYAYEITPPTNTSKTKLVLALDGETFARTSNGMVFEDYHVTNTKYLTLEKRFNTWNAQLENKYKTNGYKKTENIKRLEKEINLLARKMKNIRKNWANETIHKIVSTHPGEIIVVMRDHDSQIIDKKWGNVMTFYLMLQRKCASNNIRITMTYDKESQKRENSEVLRETA